MTWKRHFRIVNAPNAPTVPIADSGASAGTGSKYASYLPEVYSGHPNRIQRYYQYDDMDRDSDINAALDTIADFCTQSEEQNDQPFLITYNDGANDTEVRLVKTALDKWTKLNEFKQRLWNIFRGTIKNGDQFFLRDPETAEWLWMDNFMVEMVKVDDEGGKEPEEYIIRGLDYNKQAKFATKSADTSQYRTPFGLSTVAGTRPTSATTGGAAAAFSLAGTNTDPRSRQLMGALTDQLFVVNADHVIHLSLSVGTDVNWPFGQSVLEPVFKVYKQKELLEDSIIIYRVQRAPERRIFYIDVGTMNPIRARAHIEQIKNDIHQRRIPNRTGTGGSIIDAAYNPLCIALDTKIPLLDGRILTVAELAEEYRSGKENWVYSCDPITGEIMPGNITWAGVTRKAAKVIKIHLDNDESLICTPDHKIPVLGKGFVEAKDLTPNDSLIAHNTRYRNIDRKLKNERTYRQTYDHKSKKWVYDHRMVGEFFKKFHKHVEYTFDENISGEKNTIHHVDYNRYNNDPSNLVYMNKEDHVQYHISTRQAYWDNLTPEENDRIRSKISTSLRSHFARRTDDERKDFAAFSSIRNKKWIAKKKSNDPEGFAKWRTDIGHGVSTYFRANPEEAFARSVLAVERGLDNYRNQSTVVTPKMMQMLVEVVKAHKPTRPQAAALLTANVEFMAAFRAANVIQPGHANHIDYDKVCPQRLDIMVTSAGYTGWRDFTRKTALYNHRITHIEELDETIDVGTLTIDGKEQFHGHHTFAISAGIFIKNSMMDDYFFAQSSEGRGSKVETLPGGEMTGEIGDLLYFTKKMARGLRIPSSYLSLGDEDGGSGISYNDGKMGSAIIQEYRFNKYCMRIQALLAPKFDKEFKTYLKDCGIEIDNNLFELNFNPPQNFTKYRQIELDSQQMNVYSQVAENKRLSERFKLKRFLNLTEEEILENEEWWKEENAAKLKKVTGSTAAETENPDGLGAVGVRDFGGDNFDINAPIEDQPDSEGGPEGEGGEGGPAGPGGAGPTTGGPQGAMGGGGAAPPPAGGPPQG